MNIQEKNLRKQFIERQYQRDSDNRIIIHMTVKDDTDFLSVFSENDTPVIREEVAEFIESRTESIPPFESLTLRIHSDCIDDQEKKEYKAAIKEYYTEKYFSNYRELKESKVISHLLLVAGIIVLALAILLQYKANSIIWSEVIDIVAWVLLWEAADISIFKNRSLKWKKKHYLSYISMKIEYLPLTKNN